MDLTVELFDELIRKIGEKRVKIAEEDPPNETQATMTEGVIIGLDMAEAIVHEVFGRQPLITKSGKVLTDEDIERLADEAERGYDIENLKERKPRE